MFMGYAWTLHGPGLLTGCRVLERGLGRHLLKLLSVDGLSRLKGGSYLVGLLDHSFNLDEMEYLSQGHATCRARSAWSAATAPYTDSGQCSTSRFSLAFRFQVSVLLLSAINSAWMCVQSGRDVSFKPRWVAASEENKEKDTSEIDEFQGGGDHEADGFGSPGGASYAENFCVSSGTVAA